MKRCWITLVCGVVCLAQDKPQDPKQEWAEKWALRLRQASDEHYRLGDYLEMVKMFAWSHAEYLKAVDLNPDNERARKRLGQKKDESGSWVADPAARVELSNKKTGADEFKIEEEYIKKQEKMGRPLSKSFTDLGNWAKQHQLTDEATLAYKKALEYDTDNVKAHEALGYAKQGDRWVSPWEKSMQVDFKDGIAKEAQGAEDSTQTKVEAAMGEKHAKRKSERFLIESPHLSQQQLGKCLQCAEHAVAMYKKIFSLEADPLPKQAWPMNHILLQNQAQHGAFIDKTDTRSDSEKKKVKELVGSSGVSPAFGECWQGDHPDTFLYDFVIHTTLHALSAWHQRGDRPWLQEGMAYYFTRLMNGTAQVYCVRFEGTKTEGGKTFNDPNNWPNIIREWMKTNKDPDINAVVKSTLVDLTAERTVKAWSLIDFMFAEHREKFAEFHKALAEDPKDHGEKALQKAFGWTMEELDKRWKEFARRAY